MVRPYRYFQILFWGLFFQLLLSTVSYAESIVPFQMHYPKARHYQAASMGEDCGIYRSMKAKADREVERARVLELKYSQLLVQNRQALESCAKQNGIEDLEDERDEVLAAEVCASFYQAWLQPAARLELLGADLKESLETRNVMAARLNSYCGHISENSADSDEDPGNG